MGCGGPGDGNIAINRGNLSKNLGIPVPVSGEKRLFLGRIPFKQLK
jgi:hypothetical protein